jgi:hypothetical protein
MTEQEKIISTAYNSMREKYSVKGEERYDKKSIVSMLKEAGLPGSAKYLSSYVEVGMLEKHGLHYFSFPQTPIHYSTITKALKLARSKNKEYVKKWYAEHKGKKASKPILEAKPDAFNEEVAINELKLRGYKIYKARVEWDEL